MAVTLSHQSALDALRTLRSKGTSVHQMEAVPLASPSAWVGKRLGAQNFKPDVWRWQQPQVARLAFSPSAAVICAHMGGWFGQAMNSQAWPYYLVAIICQ